MLMPLLSLLVATAVQGATATPDPIRYDVRFPNRVHHEAEISVTWTNVPSGVLAARMSRSSPGRYALHEFAKNLYSVRAEDGAGRSLAIEQASPYQWNVSGHDGTVRMHYTLFADRAGGTYSGIDLTHAHLNMPATFMWARGLDAHPIEVAFHDIPNDWHVFTQLQPTDDPTRWRARDLQYFMDSPTEVGPGVLRSWTVSSPTGPATIRLAIHHAGTDAEVDRYVGMIQAVMAQHLGVYGEYPAFDYGTYTFLADYLPHVSGDGMEHRNSTIVSSTGSLAASALGLLGTVSHEFFHAWNVERIRPAGIEPFDFEAANMSGELWLAEGFTSYYGPLGIRRAGLTDDARYARGISGGVNALTNAPGRHFFSPRGMSMQAPFVDAAQSIDPQNKSNTFISYYTYGAALGLALDLTLRGRPGGITLDDFMGTMWRTHGKTERPYSIDDVEQALASTTGDAAFAKEWIDTFVRGQALPDYPALLDQAGLIVRLRTANAPWIGDTRFRAGAEGVTLSGPTLIGSPLYQAGLDRGDVILSIDGQAVTSPEAIARIVGTTQPGQTLGITWRSRGVELSGSIEVQANPRVEVVTTESAGGQLTEAQRAFRSAWLGSKAPNGG